MNAENHVVPAPVAPKVDNLIVVRESDVSDRLLMLGMVQKTLAGCAGIAGVSKAQELELDPLLHPEKYGAYHRKTRAHRISLFNIDGTLFMYAMGSAASENPQTQANDYANFLIETLRTYRPRNVRIANFSRLLRATSLVSAIRDALKKYGCLLHADGQEIDIRQPSGDFMYHTLAMFASFERDSIVMRTTAGRIAAVMRGQPMFHPRNLPIGYKLVKGKVRPDPAQKPHVQALLEVLAQDDLNSRQKAQALSDAGIRMPRLYGTGGTDDVADSRDPKSVIRGMWKWLDLYATGTYTQQLKNPFVGVDRIGVANVVREHEDDPGVIEVPHPWGLPDGGWASPDILSAARAAATKARRVGNGAHGHRMRKPLLGLAHWIDTEDHEWILDSHSKPEYRLRRRHKGSVGPHGGWAEVSQDGELVARMKAHDLHRSIATGIITALTAGVVARRLEATSISTVAGRLIGTITDSNVCAGYEAEIKQLRDKARRLRGLVAETANVEDARPWIDDATNYERRARALEAELSERANKQSANARPFDDTVNTDAEMCARAMATLRQVKDNAPRDVCDALGRIIHNLSVTPQPDGRLRWQLWINLPTDDGAVTFGPISAEIEPVTPVRPAVSSQLTSRHRQGTGLKVLANGGHLLDALEQIPEWSLSTLRTQMKRCVTKRGLPTHLLTPLLFCPVEEVRKAIFTALSTHPNATATDLPSLATAINPDGCDVAWTEHILRTYLFPTHTSYPMTWAAKSVAPQAMLDAIHHVGGTMSLSDLSECLQQQWTRYEIMKNIHMDRIAGRTPQRVYTNKGSVWAMGPGGRLDPRSELTLIDCPHCGGRARRIWRAAEVDRQLICTECRRMPTPTSPVFPLAYLTLPSGGQPKRAAWPRHQASRARTIRDTNLTDADRRNLERQCDTCAAPYIHTGLRRRCAACSAPLPTKPRP